MTREASVFCERSFSFCALSHARFCFIHVWADGTHQTQLLVRRHPVKPRKDGDPRRPGPLLWGSPESQQHAALQ